jgi:hypothetical protein
LPRTTHPRPLHALPLPALAEALPPHPRRTLRTTGMRTAHALPLPALVKPLPAHLRRRTTGLRTAHALPLPALVKPLTAHLRRRTTGLRTAHALPLHAPAESWTSHRLFRRSAGLRPAHAGGRTPCALPLALRRSSRGPRPHRRQGGCDHKTCGQQGHPCQHPIAFHGSSPPEFLPMRKDPSLLVSGPGRQPVTGEIPCGPRVGLGQAEPLRRNPDFSPRGEHRHLSRDECNASLSVQSAIRNSRGSPTRGGTCGE